MERTEKQWVTLLEKAGLSVVKVWTPKMQLVASGTVFEATRKERATCQPSLFNQLHN
jgi:hypothetical protein